VGVDGQTAQADAEDLERNLESLLHRFKSGAYQAPPVRRVYIPKDDGRCTRPLGIPMAYAYCISLPRRLGIAVAAPTSANSLYQLTQYSGLAVADQVDSYKTSG
jgi:hypothetical protein